MRGVAVAVATALTVIAVSPVAVADDAAPAETPTPTPTETLTAATSVMPVDAAAAQRAREASYARGAGKAADLHGVLPSLYRGKWFVKKAEWKRQCIVRRETHGRYTSIGGNGRFRGAYQMNKRLARGVTYQMEREVRREMGPEAAQIVRKLRTTPANKWNRYWQDRAFWTIWHNGSGKANWRGAGCGAGS